MGSAAGAIAGGVAAVGGGLIGQAGADKSARAAQSAAMDRQAMAEQFWNKYSVATDKAIQGLEGATIADMAQMDDIISRQEKNLARQEQMISQIDPTIIEASQQALKLLRGESASTLGPLQNQRSMQRQKLVDSLRQQLGPGAETSTAGIQALTRFDSETSSLMSNAQQGALGMLGGLATQFTSTRPDISGELGRQGAFSGRRLGSAQGLFDARLREWEGKRGAFAPVIGAAGAQHVAGQLQGQYQAGLGGKIMGFGMNMLGGAAGGSKSNGGEEGSAAGMMG